jgi:hypothetical protein
MKLSELKPCDCCGGPIVKDGNITWMVIKTSLAVISPKAAQQVMGMTQYFGGALGLAEAMSPEPEAVKIVANEQDGQWSEIHVCMDCYMLKLGAIAGLAERE